MIKLKNISKVFKQGKQQIIALDNVTLDVASGEIFGVIGSSGAGKSTLIRCINLLERPTSGDVIVAEKNLLQLSSKQLMLARKDISMIFQHFNLLSQRTVFENIAFPLKLTGISAKEIHLRVNHLLELVGLSDKQFSYPSRLSGGQKQRVAIARALATNPKVLLCDEATSALDPATTQSILDLLKNINRQLGLTILLITHEMSVVKNICDNVAVISSGKLIEQNTVGALFSSPKTKLAQQFIESTMQINIPENYRDKLKPIATENAHALLCLTFTGESVDSPIISEISYRFNVSLSILSAQIDYTGGIKFGVMLVELFTSPKNVEPVVNYLIEKQVKVEVLGYV